MAKIIRIPQNRESKTFYNFIFLYKDGKEFSGETLEEAFMHQKDAWEPHISMSEYLERMRDRLLFLYGNLYDFKSIEELIELLVELDLLEVKMNE